MAHGGARAGAGRKASGTNQKTREIAEKAIHEGITPLEVMLCAMRAHYASGLWDAAAAIAKDAAPYMHPRLTSVTLGGDKDKPLSIRLTDDRIAIANRFVEKQTGKNA